MLLSPRITSNNMKITYDKKIDAGYVYLNDKSIAKTLPINEWLILDVDNDQKIVGIEMLDVSIRLSEKNLTAFKESKMKTLPIEVLSCIPSFV